MLELAISNFPLFLCHFWALDWPLFWRVDGGYQSDGLTIGPTTMRTPKRYGMAQEGVISHSILFWNVRVGGFVLQRRFCMTERMLSLWLAAPAIL